MPRISDPKLLAQLETSQGSINKGRAAPDQLTGNARNQALQKIKSLEALRRQAVTAATLYNANFRRGAGRGWAAEIMPAWMSDTNAQYDAAIDGLAPLARAAFRVPGSGADSDKESQAFMNVVPSRMSNDYAAKQKYQQMLQIIDGSVADQKAGLGIDTAAPARRGFKVIR